MVTLNKPLHLVIPLPKVSGLSGIFLFAERVLHRHEGNAKLRYLDAIELKVSPVSSR